jgi:hypothetical protein
LASVSNSKSIDRLEQKLNELITTRNTVLVLEDFEAKKGEVDGVINRARIL